MDPNVLDCDTVEFDRGVCVCKGGPSLGILKDVQRAYEERIELIHKVGGRNKLQKELQLMRSWVGDLVEQNGLLSRAVEEMEVEISSKVVLERRRNTERDQKKTICDKVNELKVVNDLLQRENFTKDRQIQKLTKDIQDCEQTIDSLKTEMSLSRSVPTKDEEVMTEHCPPSTECGEIARLQDCTTRKETAKYQERMHQLEANLKSSNESIRAMRKENVDLKVEIRAMNHMCAAVDEQLHAAALRLQFKDDIIREMRRQLRQAKDKLKVTKSTKPGLNAMSGDREMAGSATISYDSMLACVRKQPHRKSRMRGEMDVMNIEWECHSPSGASADEAASIKVD